MWADLINKDKVHRVLWCALYMAVTLLLQNTVFAHIALFGVHAMFVPAVVVAVGVFEGGTWGAVFGLIAGYFGAMGYPGTGMLFAVLFAVIGFGAGMLAEYLINNSLLPFLVTCLAAFLLTAFCQMFRLWIFHGASFWRLLAVALGQSVLAAARHPVLLYQPCVSPPACPALSLSARPTPKGSSPWKNPSNPAASPRSRASLCCS